MNSTAQALAITRFTLRSLPQRLGSSLVIVIGIGGVVGVLLAVMAMAAGFASTMGDTGKPGRVIVLSAVNAGSESQSTLSREAATALLDAPGIARDAAGEPLASAEVVTGVRFPRANGARTNAPVRGVGPAAFSLRPEIKLAGGRMFQPGLRELIAGTALEARTGIGVGDTVRLRDGAWTVVGAFTSGDSHASELWGDADTSLSALGRSEYQSVTARITSAEDLATFKNAIAANPLLAVRVFSEPEYYRERSDNIGSGLYLLGWVVGGIMGVGALFGALNTMYASVATRIREIAMLRAIGFNAGAVVASIFAEALFLALVGGVIGAVISVLIFNGHEVSTVATGSVSEGQMTFTMTMSPALLIAAIGFAAALGLGGALFPAIRAARLPVATALQVR